MRFILDRVKQVSFGCDLSDCKAKYEQYFEGGHTLGPTACTDHLATQPRYVHPDYGDPELVPTPSTRLLGSIHYMGCLLGSGVHPSVAAAPATKYCGKLYGRQVVPAH